MRLYKIGQRHGGFLGILQRALARASPHLWFERSEAKDREIVAMRWLLYIFFFFATLEIKNLNINWDNNYVS